jgi:multidrug efflux pump subunit AcrA (membrane-fusion protein)
LKKASKQKSMKKQPEIQKEVRCRVNEVVLFLLFVLLIISCRESSPGEYTIMSGLFRQTITETGELVAVNASYVSMPRINYVYGYNFKVIGLVEHGTNVHKGDSIIKIDPSSIYKYIIEKEESLENEQATANKLKVQMENTLQDLKAQLKNEQASYDLKKIERDRSFFESENTRRVKELEFLQAEIKLNKVKRNQRLRPIIDSLDYKIQKIKVMQREAELRSARETLKLMLIKSPGDGILQIRNNMRTGQTIRLGDEVYLGSLIASIPDIRRMKALTFANETDISKIRSGMNVIVRLDALPSVPFHGEISEISKICTERDKDNKEKVFKVQVLISESDLRLKPGMTVSCEYVCHEGDKDLFVPNKCIYVKGNHSYIFLKKRGSFQQVEVDRGPSNTYYTVIKGNFKPDQKLELPENILTNFK